MFDLLDGPKTELEIMHGLMRRPRMKGEKTPIVRMKVRRVVQ
jgi:hypothetical protein